jgi:gliding motility-associated-like protein
MKLSSLARVSLFLCFTFLSIKALSQKQPIVSYNFDKCSTHEIFNFLDWGLASAPLVCGCGLEGQSLTLNKNQSITYPEAINQVFYNDFTIDFYVSIIPGDRPVDILSVQDKCGLDSTMTIKYLPKTDEILVELSENSGQFYSLMGKKGNQCWTRITIVRQTLNYSLYINNKLVELAQVSKEIPIAKTARLKLSGSACNDEKLNGRFDQLDIYNSALSPQDLKATYYSPNKIISKDTTIFEGASTKIEVGASCFDRFTWSPANDITNSITNTIASPKVTTTYKLTVNDKNCVDTSQIRINVIKPSDKACDKLFFPSAFTPNGDNLNDDIGISNTFIVDAIKHYEILDRWGGRIISFTAKNDRWDGRIRGQEPQLGSYIYNINYTCDSKDYSTRGSFVLMK